MEPKKAAAGNPWSWCLKFPDAFTERTGVLDLLAKGFHHEHLAVGNTHGSPAAVKQFIAFHNLLKSRGLAEMAPLIGISRGGLYSYNFVADNPARVSASGCSIRINQPCSLGTAALFLPN